MSRDVLLTKISWLDRIRCGFEKSYRIQFGQNNEK